jgi:hypothetical protein
MRAGCTGRRLPLLISSDIRKCITMADVLIRDVPEAVLAGVDAHAARLGLSRVEYIRRRLASDASTSNSPVSASDLRAFSDRFADLADPDTMDAAWK